MGDQQSPINLDTTTAVTIGTSGDLKFTKYDLINRENTNFENNGHTAELEVFGITYSVFTEMKNVPS